MLYKRRFARTCHANDCHATAANNLQVNVDQGGPDVRPGLIGVGEMPDSDNRIVQGSISWAIASMVSACSERLKPAWRKRAASSSGAGIANFKARKRSRSTKMEARPPFEKIKTSSQPRNWFSPGALTTLGGEWNNA